MEKEKELKQLGIVIIGRNEGELLKRSLLSLPKQAELLYVDSGSMDGSVELVHSLGVAVHELNPISAFSAARARREGVEILLKRNPDMKYIQFVDGDCEIERKWINNAIGFLHEHNDVAVVCGMLEEYNPKGSIYNWLSSLQWDAPLGDIDACGGIFMIRKDSYEATGGFNAELLTREERDLCERIKRAGGRIIRLDSLMAKHDSGLLRFSQWWGRAVWGGYGDAVQIGIEKAEFNREQRNRMRRYITWPFALPILGLIGLIGGLWFPWMLIVPCVCLCTYLMLFFKLFMYRIQKGNSIQEAGVYAFFNILRKFAAGYGFALYFLQGKKKKKRPDPHIIL